MTDRLPAPWTASSNDDAYFVDDANGTRLVWIYFRDNPPVGTGPTRLTRDQARRLAANIARLPDLLKKP